LENNNVSLCICGFIVDLDSDGKFVEHLDQYVMELCPCVGQRPNLIHELKEKLVNSYHK
jgi:hypothetical protein